jgi:hypothetical protein
MADLNLLSFPKGIGSDVISGQPYMLLTSYESKNAIESTGQVSHAGNDTYEPGIAKSSIALYIPPNALRTAFGATYEESPGAAMKAGGASALGNMNLNAFRQGADPGNILETLMAGVKGAGQVMGEKVAAGIDKGTGMLAAQGIAVNNHLALTYKGPTQFRTHDFVFNFFPKDKPEADEVQKILKDFENGMLPRLGGGMTMVKGRTLSSPFFQSPRHWTIDFFTKTGSRNTYLFQIKKSVITAMGVNHDPNSTVSLHKGTGSPVQTSLSLTFKEIELPVSKDKGIDMSKQIEAAAIQADNAVDTNILRATNRSGSNVQ